MKKIWTDIVGYEGLYMISSSGDILSVKTNKTRKPTTVRGGYKQLGLINKNGEKRFLLVHRLVLEAFKGKCPEGMEARHLDSNPSNNTLSNLEWGTHRQNELDKHITGKSHAKLSEIKVLYARTLVKSGVSLYRAAKMFCVDDSTMKNAVIGETWRHV